MTISTPPSFDQLFQNQQAQRRSSTGNSFPNFDGQHAALDAGYHGQLGGGDLPLTDEPQALHRKGSNASLLDGGGRPGSSTSLALAEDDLRKYTIPFYPESSSTIIATAPRGGKPSPGLPGSTAIGEIMFAQAPHPPIHSPAPVQSTFSPMPQPQSFQNHAPAPWDPSNEHMMQYADLTPIHNEYQSGMNPPPTASSSHTSLYNHPSASPYSNSAMTPGVSAGWSADFLDQQRAQGDYAGAEEQGGWNTGTEDQGFERHINELERIYSNTSSPGSHHTSRAHSPFLQNDPPMDYLQMEASTTPLSQSSFGPNRHDSHPSSRSGSPFSPQVNDTFPRAGSASPFINKPQSPPALVIPNQHSPAPSLPPIVTTSSGPSNVTQPIINTATMGGLAPPVNPALEHLTGMAGISPIAPSADGPQIYIQPSTPISGLKDSRGVFEAALKRAGQQAQEQQQQQQQQQQQMGQQTEGYANVPPPASHPLSRPGSTVPMEPNQVANQPTPQDFAAAMQAMSNQWLTEGYNQFDALRPNLANRPRAKSDSQMGMTGQDGFDRAAFLQAMGMGGGGANSEAFPMPEQGRDWRNQIDSWRTALISDNHPLQPTLDPRTLPGQETTQQEMLQQLLLSQQYNQLQAQRDRLPSLNTNAAAAGQQPQPGGLQYESGQFSPTSLAFYQQLGIQPTEAGQLAGTASAPYHQTAFPPPGQTPPVQPHGWPASAGPMQQTFLSVDQSQGQGQGGGGGGIGPRRRSFAEGTTHPAAGAGTPGYGVEFTSGVPFTNFGQNGNGSGSRQAGRVSPLGHRRSVKSEDLGRGSGWGVGAGGSTSDFLQSITANDGSLLPPSRARSHSRHSSASSQRSASPALSISSQGSSFSHHSGRMELPEGVQPPDLLGDASKNAGGKPRIQKMKVTSVATEVASSSRRTNEGVFRCPVPGCGSTFTRHFNLKGHMRSHNDERPYKCLYDGCPKSVVGFARQHDCKRHMALHEGLRPFECEGCGKKFARLDALTRHHKSEQGQECAISHPLPTNPDGSPMSESQYKAYRLAQQNATVAAGGAGPGGGRARVPSFSGYPSGDERSGAEDDIGTGSGMDEYDQF